MRANQRWCRARRVCAPLLAALALSACSPATSASPSSASRAIDAATPIPTTFEERPSPLPATTDQQVTGSTLAQAFTLTGAEPHLRARGVTTSRGPGYGSEILERDFIAAQDGTAFAFHARRTGLFDVERSLPPMTNGSLTPTIDSDSFVVRMQFLVADGLFWHNAPAIGDAGQRWRTAAISELSALSTNPFHYIERVEGALIGDPLETAILADGTRRVAVEFSGDMIAPFFRSEMNPNLDLRRGNFVFDGALRGSIDVSTDGYIAYVEVDIAPWFVAFFESTISNEQYLETARLDELEAIYSLAIARVEGGLVVTSPCPTNDMESCT